MSWFDTAGFATLAKSALTTAQKTIDRALDIQDGQGGAGLPSESPKEILGSPSEQIKIKEEDGFFATFGLQNDEGLSTLKQPSKTPSPASAPSSPQKCKSILEKPSTSSSSGMWGDWGSFYLPKLQSSHESQLISEPETNINPAQNNDPIETNVDDSETKVPEEPSMPELKELDHVPSMVFLQPQAEKLFPDKQEIAIKEDDSNFCKPIEVFSKQKKIVEHSNTKEDHETHQEMTAETEPPLLMASLIHPEMSPIQLPPTPFNETPNTFDSGIVPELTENISKNNDSTDTLRELSDDDDDDETEEELTVMEKKPSPKSNDRHLDLPVKPCFKNPAGQDASPSTEYCFVDQNMEDIKPDSPLKTDKDSSSMSCSTSMEIITEHDSTFLQSFQPITSHGARTTPSHDTFSSPDSVVPIQEEPLSNLASPHFPDIHVMIPPNSEFITLPLDMCDSDVTLLSPSAGEEESTDSEKDVALALGVFSGTEPHEVRECETSSSGSKTSNSSSSGSFVNCSLEDADPCYQTREHSGSSTVPSERSDPGMRPETETSGHTSGDDMETTTSSDIEIISPSNGENSNNTSSSHPLSPLKHHIWVPRPHRSKRSESPASDSSKEGMMPVVHEFEELKGASFMGSDPNSDQETLLKRLSSLQEVLEARENRVMDLSKENIDLHEVNTSLKNHIQKMEETHIKDNEGVSKMTREFSQRLSQMESKLEETTKDRNAIQIQLTSLRKETTSKMSVSEMESLIVEKDQQIAELMQEGEKLSKQQLNLSNIIKKLRNKEKETETTLKSQKEKLDEQTKEIERLRKSLGAKDDQEKKHIDAIRQLTTTVYKHEEEIASLKSELEDANDKQRSMKTNLDAAYKEMTNAQKKLAEKEGEIQEATISAEMVAKESLRFQLERVQEQAVQERDTLLAQVTELRVTLAKVEQQSNLREEALRMDIANLQRRLEDADARNDELTQSVSSATRPLLRQLDNLQSVHSNQTASWDKIEKGLTERLTLAQSQLSTIKEQERFLNERIRDLTSKVSALETRNKAISHEKIQLTSQVEVLKAKIALNEESKHRDAKSVTSLKQKFAEEITTLKKEKEEARQEIDRLKADVERRKQLEVSLMEEPVEEIPGRSSPSLSMTLSQHSSVSDTFRAWGQDVGSEAGYEVGNRPALYEQWWGGSASSLIETLQSQVKLREGEIQQLQREISQLEHVRESMVEELGRSARKSDEFEIQLADHQGLKDAYKDTEQKYNTLLQMYGEKVEEAEELRLDLTDVKAMYKAQIEELLANS